MVARLGFAVATSWVPEILILDEILAVGDEEFRAKCYHRIAEFQRNGTTTLIVSHDMNTIMKQCRRAVWLEHGTVQSEGPAVDVINAYHNSNNNN
jgi:ABC-2 type transport system ATP-binding protein/lipopolysaccharide transport system ATP-binding protein